MEEVDDEEDGDDVGEYVEDIDVCVEGCSLGVEGSLASQLLENPEYQEGQGLEEEGYQ